MDPAIRPQTAATTASAAERASESLSARCSAFCSRRALIAHAGNHRVSAAGRSPSRASSHSSDIPSIS